MRNLKTVLNKKTKKPEIVDTGYFICECMFKKDLKELSYIPVDFEYRELVILLNLPYVCSCKDKILYILEKDYKTIKKVISTDYKPLVFPNTEKPVWFDVEGILVKLNTAEAEECGRSWFRFLYNHCDIVRKEMLVEYKPLKKKVN